MGLMSFSKKTPGILLLSIDNRLHGSLPMRRGFLYLVAIMDWFTRKVLALRISNTL